MTDAAQAFINKGARGNWPPTNNPPSHSIGFTLGHGSWPEWHAKNSDRTARLWRNPNGDLWDQPARYGTISAWKPAKATGWFLFDFLRQLRQYALDLEAIRRPLVIPWGKNWSGAGGTQPGSSDNGCIINIDDQRSYEIQGLAPLSATDVLQINARALATVAYLGDYRCDGIAARAPGVKPVGSQGPWWKRDGLLRPDDLSRPWTEPKRLVVFNTQFGPNAQARKPGWVEHTGSTPPVEGLPANGTDPDLIRCAEWLKLDITDDEIEQWITDEDVDPRTNLAESMRCLARGCRSQGLQVRERGTGNPIIESTGGTVPAERSAWAARGVTSEDIARNLGRNLFRYGRLYTA